jgi:hypothetical protein
MEAWRIVRPLPKATQTGTSVSTYVDGTVAIACECLRVGVEREAYGAVMKEYVAVPDGVLGKTKELQKYVAASHDYAKSLKAKPTKKKR